MVGYAAGRNGKAESLKAMYNRRAANNMNY